jgi:hypothetical protein
MPPAEDHGAKHRSCRSTLMNEHAQDEKMKWVTPAEGLWVASYDWKI